MEYIIDIDDERLVEFLEKIEGIYDINEYVPSDEIKAGRLASERYKKAADNRVEDYQVIIADLKVDLDKERKKPIPVTPDYVELIKLRRDKELWLFWEKLALEIQKDMDITRYIKKVNGL